jgi:hypothetical protein
LAETPSRRAASAGFKNRWEGFTDHLEFTHRCRYRGGPRDRVNNALLEGDIWQGCLRQRLLRLPEIGRQLLDLFRGWGVKSSQGPSLRRQKMPNCDFFATPEDHALVLDWLFADGACEVYELSSDFEQPLKRFRSSVDVLQQFDRRHRNGEVWHKVHLQLYVVGARPPFNARRVKLDPESCNGATFRYAADGWGLVSLYLAALRGERLENSHTNHNSAKRAEARAPHGGVKPGPDAWDFKRIGAFSARLNRQIRKLGVGKSGCSA